MNTLILLVALLAAGDVRLAWDAPAPVVPEGYRYRVYKGTVSGQLALHADVGNVLAYTVTGLAPGTYYFAVTAYTSLGESDQSNEVIADVGAAPFTMTAGPTVSNIGQNSALVSWSTNIASGTRLKWGPTTAFGSEQGDGTPVTNHTLWMTGLSPATLYYFEASSIDSTNTPVVGSSSLTTAPAAATLTISGVTVTQPRWGRAMISWMTNVASSSQVEYGQVNPPNLATPVDAALVTSHTVSLTSLQRHRTYYYRVRSAAADGSAVSSAVGTFYTR
jgi:hypothetical protein